MVSFLSTILPYLWFGSGFWIAGLMWGDMIQHADKYRNGKIDYSHVNAMVIVSCFFAGPWVILLTLIQGTTPEGKWVFPFYDNRKGNQS